MTTSDSLEHLTRANQQFRLGNFQEAIYLYKQAIQKDPRLTESLSANIVIAKSRLNRLLSEDKDTKYDVREDVRHTTVLDSTLMERNELYSEKSVLIAPGATSQAQSTDELSLEDIFATKPSGTVKRLLKQYDDELEARFTSEILATKNSGGSRAAKLLATIIMPTYNRARTIEKAIISVIAQTHTRWELVIIDDGSTDDTLKVLGQYKKDKRIRILNGSHNGVSAARNLGLSAAKGDYIYYLDSDNTWTPHYLEIMNLAFVYTNRMTGYAAITLQDEFGSILGYRGEPFDWAQCLEANFIDVNTFAHHKSVLKQHGPFDTSLRRMVDWDLILRYTKESAPFYAPFVGCLYLESRNDASRITLSEPLAFQKVVRLKNSIENNKPLDISKSLSLKFSIKIPAPLEEKEQWGDYHYADSLRIALEAMGHSVALDFHGAWYTRPPSSDDVIIVIRGLTAYTPKKGSINIIWNISHPDQVPVDELERYDIAYVASTSYAHLLQNYVKTKVSPLIQCSDPDRFYYRSSTAKPAKSMLFVGNSRNEYRPIVKKAIEADKDIAIYGTRWSKLVDSKYIHGDNIPNTELCAQYASYGTVLNDHWESMREFGYVSNRVFDVLASGGTLISDPVPSISYLFGDAVVQLEDSAGFETAHRQIERIEEAGEGYKRNISSYVSSHHSFRNRARVICDDVLIRLGLPAIWSNNHQIDAGDCSLVTAVDTRRTIGLILRNSATLSGHPAFRRLISPLTTDAVHTECRILLLAGIDDPLMSTCHSIIVQGTALKDPAEARRLIDIAVKSDIPLYLDVYQSCAQALATDAEDGLKAQAMLLVMHSASHVWFSTTRLALSYCHAYRNASIVADSIDPRFWRNYRKAAPRAALSVKYRILYLATLSDSQAIWFVIPALDRLFSERGAIFELIILGDVSKIPERPWIHHIQPTERRSMFPLYANWLINAERFDIGIAPIGNGEYDSTSSDCCFLHYTALGIPTLCSRSVSFSELSEKGVVLASENDTEQWFRSFSIAIDNRELMLDMVNRAWSYTWHYRSAAGAGKSMLHTINSNITKPLAVNPSPKLATKTIAVCVHLYYIEQWPKIRSHLRLIDKAFDLYVTCTYKNKDEVVRLMITDYTDAIVVAVDNHGMDVLPFLLVNHDFELWRYTAVLKLHTKNSKTADDRIFGDICYESLLSSYQFTNAIINRFESDHNIGLVGPEVLYRSANSLMYVNAPGVRDVFDLLGVSYPKSDWGFFAGTMFWIRGSLLHALASNFHAIQHLASQDSKVAASGGDGTWAHAMERIFGALPVLQCMYSAAAYVETPSKSSWGIRPISDGEFTKSLSFRVSSKWHTARFANLGRWADLCSNSELFDSDYYVQQSGGIIPDNMEPIAHYILYGDDLAMNPSAAFSTAYYKIKHSDVIAARIPMLVHYLVHGQREGRMIAAVADY